MRFLRKPRLEAIGLLLFCLPLLPVLGLFSVHTENYPQIEFVINTKDKVSFDLTHAVNQSLDIKSVQILLPFTCEEVESGDEVIVTWRSLAEDYTLCVAFVLPDQTQISIQGTSRSLIRQSSLGADWLEFNLDFRSQNLPPAIRQLISQNQTISQFHTILVKFPPGTDQNRITDNPSPSSILRNTRNYNYSDIQNQGGVLRIIYPNPSVFSLLVVEAIVACFVTGGGFALSWIRIGEERVEKHKRFIQIICALSWAILVAVSYIWWVFGEWPYNPIMPFFFGLIPPAIALSFLSLDGKRLQHLFLL